MPAGYVCNVERRGRKTAHLIELGVRAVSAAHTLHTHVRVNYHELSLLQVRRWALLRVERYRAHAAVHWHGVNT